MAISEKVQSMVGVTPSHTDEERESIRSEARKKATSKWFSLVLDHHEKLEELFAKVMDATNSSERAAAQKQLMLVLTGHSIAEEAIIYPFMKIDTSSMDAKHVYAEQSLAKIEMVELDNIQNKMSPEYEDKLEEILKAVTHHMIEEERDYFPALQEKADKATNAKITLHYQTEFERYTREAE